MEFNVKLQELRNAYFIKIYEYVYPACGTPNTAVKLRIEDLEKASNYVEWVDVCKE